jgi:hypothetical protein
VLLAVGALALVAAAPASAKWCARISASPARPVVGQPVTLRLRTSEPVLVRDGWARPGTPTRVGAPLMLLVLPPRGEFTGLDLRRRRDDPSIWQTTFVFRKPGVWRVRVIDETPLGPGCRGRVSVKVARRS